MKRQFNRQLFIHGIHGILKSNSNKFITQIAANNVNINETITTIVANKRFSENIFFNCFTGPTKKHVLLFQINHKPNYHYTNIHVCEKKKWKSNDLLMGNWYEIDLIESFTFPLKLYFQEYRKWQIEPFLNAASTQQHPLMKILFQSQNKMQSLWHELTSSM